MGNRTSGPPCQFSPEHQAAIKKDTRLVGEIACSYGVSAEVILRIQGKRSREGVVALTAVNSWLAECLATPSWQGIRRAKRAGPCPVSGEEQKTYYSRS